MNQDQTKLIEKFRDEILKRGPAGIKEIGSYFRQVDDDKSKQISFDEFLNGIINHNIRMTRQEVTDLFSLFDRNSNGSIDYEEFLLTCRPPLNKNRLSIIARAFQKMDKTGDKKITIEDLKNVYSVKQNPKFISGELTENQLLQAFLDSFEVSKHKDGIITFDEFVEYYAGVSASIDTDAYFDVMMRVCWKL